jgi:S1-C subfamily serine protease
VYDGNGDAYASGSGFFIDSSGLAVTNYHVIEGASAAAILTTDGEVYDVLGVYDYSEDYDLALLQIDGSGFPILPLGDSDAVAAGATVYAIGNPLGLTNTISQGIVSNAARNFRISCLRSALSNSMRLFPPAAAAARSSTRTARSSA